MGGGTPIGKAPGSLIGRDDDLEYVTAFVGQAAVSGGALLLSGEAGVGKSVLLDAAAAHAEIAGSRVFRAAGAEFEGDVGFAGLNQLLGPLLGHGRGLSAAYRRAQDDAAVTRRVIDDLDGPVVLVGHSYGGAVITEAGLHEKVAAVVYIAAFAPDKGESVNTLLAGFPADAPQPPILPPKDGFLFLDREKFAASFAGDLPAGQAAFMADSQVPWGVDALGGTITEASWRLKPSWYLVASEDRMIPPPAQRAMSERAGSTATEAPGSHSIYLSQPAAVAALISQAATATRGQAAKP